MRLLIRCWIYLIISDELSFYSNKAKKSLVPCFASKSPTFRAITRPFHSRLVYGLVNTNFLDRSLCAMKCFLLVAKIIVCYLIVRSRQKNISASHNTRETSAPVHGQTLAVYAIKTHPNECFLC